MTTEIRYYNQNDPATVLNLSQKAASILSKSSLKTKSLLLSIFSPVEEPTEWAELEQIFLSCLRTGDDESALLCLERVAQRFGEKNYRVMALRGLYQEAVAKNEEELRRVLQNYNQIIKEDPMNIPIHKRRNALIRSFDRPVDALECLVAFLASFPSDAEAWCELSDLYQSQGLSSQAIYCMEEAVLITPNAWNLHARLGELNYMASQSTQDGVVASQKYLAEAVRRFARSVELCQDYLRGYYGLKLATDRLSKSVASKEFEEMSSASLQQMNRLAVTRLKRIIQEGASSNSTVRQAEIIAAKALLDEAGD